QAIDRIPIFLLGSLIASLMEEDKTVPVWLPIVGILFFAVGQVFMMRNGDLWYEWLCLLYLVMVPSASLLFGKIAEHFKRGLLLRFLAFMGSISLELYLLYSRIYYRMRIISAHLPQQMWLVLSVPLTVLIAWLFKKVTDEIAHRTQNLKG
ncbi:MAG: hypothetical protein MJ099_06120, partial [Clostridia bacterium]|nr:hypothetical protein [Clostridia bacterium]